MLFSMTYIDGTENLIPGKVEAWLEKVKGGLLNFESESAQNLVSILEYCAKELFDQDP